MTDELPDIMFRAAVRSNVGLVRQNNQDSGYVGPNLLLVADGMGGHAGGDVASAITVSRLSALDTISHNNDLLGELRSAILEANERINAAVEERPELAGMGTTVTALLRDKGRLCLAHIGDSRAYLLRNGEFTQMTSDHTFVQMLVDEGRITEDEAEHHPQRSVVMKVLGDVGSTPELDMSIRNAQLGDRWLLCSDGLTGFASSGDIKLVLETVADPNDACDQLVDLALDGGGADNVTVIVADVVEADPTAAENPGSDAGSVRINPHYALLGSSAEPTRQMNVLDDDPEADTAVMHAGDIAAMGNTSTTAAEDPKPEDSIPAEPTPPPNPAVQPQEERAVTSASSIEEEDEDDEEIDEAPARKRGVFGWIVAVVVIAVLAGAGVFGWNYVNSQYYVTAQDGKVVVYRGVSQDLGPISLSHLDETTDIDVANLSSFSQDRLQQTIPANSKNAADKVVENLRDEASRDEGSNPMEGTVSDGNDPAPSEGGGATPDGEEP